MKQLAALIVCIFVLGAVVVYGQDNDNGAELAPSAAEINSAVRNLGSRDASIRRQAAEDLARLAPVDQTRLIEGYRLQEKDKQVSLALDWALYRLGTSERLYPIVNELAGKNGGQASGYLGQVDDPSVLYPLLNSTNGKTLAGVLKALGQAGNVQTISRISIFKNNSDPAIAAAAREAEKQIQHRADQSPTTPGARGRVVDTTAEPEP